MILFLFLSTVLFGPRNDYYQSVNTAELAIAEGKYAQAMQQYDAAFTIHPTPLAQDLYNASLCAIKLNNPDKALSFCLQLADKGVPPSFFSGKSCYSAIRQSPHWSAFLKEAADRQAAFKERNKGTLALLHGLLTRSDKVYKEYQQDPRSSYALNEYRWAGDSLCKIVLHYLNETGYPSEERFGVAIVKDTILDARPVFFRIMDRRPLLVNVSLDPVFLRLFYERGVNTGQLKPEQALVLLRGRMTFREEHAVHYYTLYGKHLYSESDITPREAMTIRKSLGLPGLDEELIKVKAALSHRPADFLFSVFLTQQRAPNEPLVHEQQFLQAHTLTVNNIAPDGP